MGSNTKVFVFKSMYLKVFKYIEKVFVFKYFQFFSQVFVFVFKYIEKVFVFSNTLYFFMKIVVITINIYMIYTNICTCIVRQK